MSDPIKCTERLCRENAVLRRDGEPVCLQHGTPNTLAPDAPTDDTYRTRCPVCKRPVHFLAVFPGDLCPDDYETAHRNDPLPTADELARMWGADI